MPTRWNSQSSRCVAASPHSTLPLDASPEIDRRVRCGSDHGEGAMALVNSAGANTAGQQIALRGIG